MSEGELNTDGAGSTGQADYDKWFEVGQKIERAKNEGKSY